MQNQSSHIAIACSIFRKEIEYLIENGQLPDSFIFVNSDLHMNPEKLSQVLDELIKPECLVCYGDCHSHLVGQDLEGQIARINGLNCIEVFLGREYYRKLRREGAFFLLPEWTYKWDHIFKELLGFKDQKVAALFMNEMHKKFIFVNTGVYEIPFATLDSISAYFSLPVEIIDIDLENLETSIKNGLKKLDNEG